MIVEEAVGEHVKMVNQMKGVPGKLVGFVLTLFFCFAVWLEVLGYIYVPYRCIA